MAKNWSGKHDFAHLSGELAVSEDRDFERRALPLIRAIWPEAVTPPSKRSFDQSGIDHLIWADEQPFPLVIQCKGFRSSEHEIGDLQTRQCLDSIQSFRKSGLKAVTYVLLHNRDGRNKKFTESIQNGLGDLVSSGQVERAFLWDRHTFLNQAFESTFQRVLTHLTKSSNDEAIFGEARSYDPLETVPLTIGELVVNQYRLEQQTQGRVTLSDPSKEILDAEPGNIVLLIAEAGYGKTTAALRTFSASNRKIFYLPAAKISKSAVSAKDLLCQCLDTDELFSDYEEADQPTLRHLVRPVVEFILKDRDQQLVIIIDGLDESIYFSRSGGLQLLFNQLRDVVVPVILLARTEFWRSRIQDFTASFGELSKTGQKNRKRVKLIELQPWSSSEVLFLAERFRDSLSSPVEISRVENLIEFVKSGTFEQFYGDIPRRPLFLRFILETVADQGVHYTGRARLYYDWAQMKVTRDISNPRRFSGEGRAGITTVHESTDTTLRLSFSAMIYAAATMTKVENGVLDLSNECEVDDVLKQDRVLKDLKDPTGLFLNSLLLPAPPHLPHQPIRIRFAHRTYQEFFLALYCSEHQDEFQDIRLPGPVLDMMDDLQKEGIAEHNPPERSQDSQP